MPSIKQAIGLWCPSISWRAI